MYEFSDDDVLQALNDDRYVARSATPPPVPQRLPRRTPRYPDWRLENNVRTWRAAHGVSQTDLAARVGVSRQTIGAIENRRHEPTLGLAMAIAEVIGRPVEAVFSLRRPKFRGPYG